MMEQEQLRVTTETLPGGIGLVAASGYINNEGAQAIADAVERLLAKGNSTLLVDLAGTKIINSIGISILLEILEKLLDGGGRLAFCNLTPTIAKTFEIMGLAQYAGIYPDRASALADLSTDGAA
jgi:anti-sigma B factor antagonist